MLSPTFTCWHSRVKTLDPALQTARLHVLICYTFSSCSLNFFLFVLAELSPQRMPRCWFVLFARFTTGWFDCSHLKIFGLFPKKTQLLFHLNPRVSLVCAHECLHMSICIIRIFLPHPTPTQRHIRAKGFYLSVRVIVKKLIRSSTDYWTSSPMNFSILFPMQEFNLLILYNFIILSLTIQH